MAKAVRKCRTNGTIIILCCSGHFYKALKVTDKGNSDYTFECKELYTNERKCRTRTIHSAGFFQAADAAFQKMKNPHDVFYLDIDDGAEWIVAHANYQLASQ